MIDATQIAPHLEPEREWYVH